jgi:hypothetical protein
LRSAGQGDRGFRFLGSHLGSHDVLNVAELVSGWSCHELSDQRPAGTFVDVAGRGIVDCHAQLRNPPFPAHRLRGRFSELLISTQPNSVQS